MNAPQSIRAALEERLATLYAERKQALAEQDHPGSSGDAADRALNVEAAIRLETLEANIATLEVELQQPADEPATASEAHVGSRVTVRFIDDGDTETYLVAPVDLAGNGADVVTPDSPLGRALADAHPGDKIVYQAPTKAEIKVEVIDIA